MTKVVVTGIGMLTSLGNREDTWEAIKIGKHNYQDISDRYQELGEFRTKIASFLEEELEDLYEKLKCERHVKMAIKVAEEALLDSNLILDVLDPYRLGVVMGTGMGATLLLESELENLRSFGKRKVHPNGVPNASLNSLSGQMAIKYNLKGINYTVSTACSSGGQAIGQAYEQIKAGKADVLLAGASDSPTSALVFSAFDNLRVMAPENNGCKPFSKDRSGFILGEGAAVLVMESLEHALARNAKIYGEIIGFANTCDAYSMILPVQTGETIYSTMKLALDDSGISMKDIDYINAHGTGTHSGDFAEVNAIKAFIDEGCNNIPTSSIKGAIGHTQGASGAIETAISFLALRDQIFPPTVNIGEEDTDLGLDFIADVKREGKIETILKNNFGFGGNNTTLILRRF